MEYAVLFRWKEGSTPTQREVALMRLTEKSDPAGVELVAEYWLEAEDIAALSIFRAVDRVALFDIELAFGELFDVSVLSATSSEGLEKW